VQKIIKIIVKRKTIIDINITTHNCSQVEARVPRHFGQGQELHLEVKDQIKKYGILLVSIIKRQGIVSKTRLKGNTFPW
jgi:hypothetical protein